MLIYFISLFYICILFEFLGQLKFEQFDTCKKNKKQFDIFLVLFLFLVLREWQYFCPTRVYCFFVLVFSHIQGRAGGNSFERFFFLVFSHVVFVFSHIQGLAGGNSL